MSALPPAPSFPAVPVRKSVVVTDVDMSIVKMCKFMVKWVIASIPAVIILWLLMLCVGVVIATVFGGAIAGIMHMRT